VHQLSQGHNEALFKHAHEFHPERWLDDPEYKDDQLDAVEPFSTGPRNCLGKNLAWLEMRLILAATVLGFDLELGEESKNWANQKIYTLWEKVPLKVRVKAVER
jgi:cytochrome P450